ncbi:MAG: thymidine phosphorylase, partial [Candidatus Diapherotrites archaeon]|nr:thymidine phosphorylase [Candidatus Diapherotrites archaeon]
AAKLAGVELKTSKGQKVKKGEVLFEIHAENRQKLDLALKLADKDTGIRLHKTVIEKIK